MHTINKEDEYQLKTYEKFPIAIIRGRGMHVYDSKGKRYLDFYGGHGVALTGHCHPKVVSAIKKQTEKLIFYSSAVYSDIRADVAEKIVKFSNLSKVFFCNSGTEANETAMKMVRRFTGKEEIITMKGSFHGRTIGSLSATGIEKYRIFKLLPDFKFAEFGNIDAVKKLVNKNTAAIMLEPIQSMAGVRIAKKDFYKELREVCDKKDIILIFDEVQTFARTGKMFAGENWHVTADIITLAKGVASGIPIGITIVNEDIAKIVKAGEYGSTFGGGQIACAAAKATLELIKEEKLTQNAERMGKYIKKKFSGYDIKTRGLGLLLGLEFSFAAKEVLRKALEKYLILGSSEDKNVLRLLPPLIVKKGHADAMIEIIGDTYEF